VSIYDIYCGILQVPDANEIVNPLVEPVETLSDGTVLMTGNMTIINLNLAGAFLINSIHCITTRYSRDSAAYCFRGRAAAVTGGNF
jgi:hypothetical protein